jgi:CHASE2 domain-containing sensor protein
MTRFAPALAAMALALGVGVTLLLTGALAGVERQTVNKRFELRDAPAPKGIVLVTIDEPSFSALREQWPFPRSLHAKAIDQLHEAGARQIVYDVQFTEPTRPREDFALYEALDRAGGVVLATGEADRRGRTNVLGGDANLADVGAVAGHSQLVNDGDGEVTRVPHSVSNLRSLAVVAAERASGKAVGPGRLGGSAALIDYRGGPGAFPSISFASIVRGRFDPERVRGQIVVVGASAPTLQDLHETPTSDSELMSGAEVQANAIWTVLHGAPLRDASRVLVLLVLLLLAIVAPLARLRLAVLPSVAAAAAAAAAYVAVAQIAFASGTVLPVVAPLAALGVGVVGMVVASHLLVSRDRRRVLEQNDVLEQRVHERTAELHESQLELIHRLSMAVERRDGETGAHIERISDLSHELALAAGLSESHADLVRHASAMHDVGKIGIPDDILLKPGKLDDAEFEVVKGHTTTGGDILAGSRSRLVQMAETIARTHHERWDGTGYPAGLVGDEIPLEGRICAICDVFDALTSRRPYKEPWPAEEALAEIERQSGRQFDPELVALFLEMAPRAAWRGAATPAAWPDASLPSSASPAPTPVAEPASRQT